MNKVNIGNDLYLKGRIGWKGLSKSEYFQTGEYRIINGTSLEDNYINWDICGFIDKKRYDESPEIMLQEGDLLISKDGTLGKIGYVKNLSKPSTIASGIFLLRNIKPDLIDTDYLYHYLKSNFFKQFVKRAKAEGSTILHLYQRDLEKCVIDLPTLKEQKKISKILNILDHKISVNLQVNNSLIQKLNLLYDFNFLQPDQNSRQHKTNLKYCEELNIHIPKTWEIRKVKTLLSKDEVSSKILSSEIKEEGKFPVIDQSDDYIAGFTDNVKSIIKCDKPRIIFGDHTRILKLVNFDFARGADGTQIIRSNTDRMPEHLFYHTLKKIDLSSYGYARHFKFLKEMPVIVPDKESAMKFEKIAIPYYKIVSNNLLQNIQIIRLREFLLPFAMASKLKIK